MSDAPTPATSRSRHLVTFGLAGATALACATFFIFPLFQTTWLQTHDWLAYPVRAIEYVAGWRSGAWWPRWAPDLYGGFGCPFFNFYSPGFFIVSGSFMLAGFSACVALKLALIAFTAVGALGVFGLAYGETGRSDAAAVAMFLFVFMGYHITQIFVRGDLAEYSAMCAAPAALWAYRAMGRVAPRRWLVVGLAAAFAHSSALLQHTLTGQWLTQFLFVVGGVTAWQAWRRGETARAFAIGVIFVAACGMTALYALPALVERPLVHIDRMTEGVLATERNTIKLAGLGDIGFYARGKALMLLPLVAVAALVRRRRVVADVVAWTLLTAGVVLSLLEFAGPLWRVIPFGRYMQFPWRLLGFVSIFGAVAWACAWRELIPRRRVLAWPLAGIVCVAVAADGWRNRPVYAAMPPPIPNTSAEVVRTVQTTVISDEYLPRTATSYPKVMKGFVVGSTATVDLTLRSGTGYKLDLSSGDGFVDLRALWFPGWKVQTLSGPAHAFVEPSPVGLVRVRLPVTGAYRVRVYFGTTPLRATATAISLLSLLLLVVLLRRLSHAQPKKTERLP